MYTRTKLSIVAGVLVPAAIFCMATFGKPKQRDELNEPLVSLKVWGNPTTLSEEDIHNLASTATMLVINSLPSTEDTEKISLPVGAEKSAVEEVMHILNLS